jgi:1-acyl-sn-glycerol-3-phosphate acyltransferase
MRALLKLPLAVAWSGAIGVVSILAGMLDRSGRMAARVARLWGRVLLGIYGVRVEVRGAEHAPSGPAVYAVNHGSALDIPVILGYVPDFRVIHRRSLYWWPVIGQFLYFGGHVGIERDKPFEARRSLEQAAARIRGGTSVAVFPEGTRSPDGRVRNFKRGTFMIAIEAGVPVVPVSLSGIKTVAARGMLRMTPGKVTVTLHPPESTQGLTADDARLLGQRVRRAVASAVAEHQAREIPA